MAHSQVVRPAALGKSLTRVAPRRHINVEDATSRPDATASEDVAAMVIQARVRQPTTANVTENGAPPLS